MNNCFIFLMLISQQGLFAQGSFSDEFKYKITYEMTHQPDSTDIESVKREAMVLYIGDEISRFSSEGKIIGDSLKNNWNGSPQDYASMRAKIPNTEFSYYIFKELPKGKISFSREIVMDNFLYNEEKDLFNWKITSQTKKIAGYECQLAKTEYAGREYVAWFTTEIPISDGPYKFHGLPGLIVKINDSKGHYNFQLTKSEKLDKPISFSFDMQDYIETSKANFIKAEKQYEQDPVSYAERTTGGTITFHTPGAREKKKRERLEKLKKQNNPLELE